MNDGYVSETYRNDIGFINAMATDKGRYYSLYSSPNVAEELTRYAVAKSPSDEDKDEM
jgi:hypothetical protein